VAQRSPFRYGQWPILCPLTSPAIRCSRSTTIPARETGAPGPNTATKLRARRAATTAEPFRASAKNQEPHRQCLLTAGSFIQDFRTPSAPETLQGSGLSAFGRTRMRAVVRDACYKSIPLNQCWQVRPRTCRVLALNGDPPGWALISSKSDRRCPSGTGSPGRRHKSRCACRGVAPVRACGQCQVDGPKVLVQAMQLGRAGDWHDPGLLCEPPRRGLRRGSPWRSATAQITSTSAGLTRR